MVFEVFANYKNLLMLINVFQNRTATNTSKDGFILTKKGNIQAFTFTKLKDLVLLYICCY